MSGKEKKNKKQNVWKNMKEKNIKSTFEVFIKNIH